MSRSSSGPGLALESPSGLGLGIVRFDPAGQLQFGEQEAISLGEARRRTGEYEAKHREEAELRGRAGVARASDGSTAKLAAGKSTPYPDINLMPTDTDEGRLGEMVGS